MLKKILLSYFSLLLIIISVWIFTNIKSKDLSLQSARLAQNESQKAVTAKSESEETAVLARANEVPPEINIHKLDTGRNQYFYGGMQGLINFSDLENPQVEINVKNVTGNLTINLYKANVNKLLTFLQHDKEFNQIDKSISTSGLEKVSSFSFNVNDVKGAGTTVNLPSGELGIWLVDVDIGGLKKQSFAVVSNFGVMTTEGETDFILWGQNYKSKKSITEGVARTYNLLNRIEVLGEDRFDAQGVSTPGYNERADVAIAESGGSVSVIPINLTSLNYGWSWSEFEEKTKNSEYFLFTDRPIYRPGDTIFFKSVIRSDNDARYSIPEGTARVRIYYEWNENENVIYDKALSVSKDGTVFGEAEIPIKAKTGSYTIMINAAGTPDVDFAYINVEYFRKPEYTLEVDSLVAEAVAGDIAGFKIKGNYFSGQPLSGVSASYTVYSYDFYDYAYYSDSRRFNESDYRYGYWYRSGNKIEEGNVLLNETGEGIVNVITQKSPTPKVYVFESTIDDGSGNPSTDQRNILVYPGYFGIYRSGSYSYSNKINQPLDLPLILIPYRSSNISNVQVNTVVTREYWVNVVKPESKYPSYEMRTDLITTLSAKTNSKGEVNFSITPSLPGTYKFKVTSQDQAENTLEKTFNSWVYDEKFAFYYSENPSGLEIQLDKEAYKPGETAKLLISPKFINTDAFVSFNRKYVNRYKIVHITKLSEVVELEIVETDMPNIFVNVGMFSGPEFTTKHLNIPVSADTKKLNVTINTNEMKFGPGEDVQIQVETKDIYGKPVSADTALWIVDKALFELITPDKRKIFDAFWSERYYETGVSNSLESINMDAAGGFGGGFTGDTLVLTEGNKFKPISEIKPGEYILTRKSYDSGELVKAKILNIHTTDAAGYLIINGDLKVTPEHILRVNDSWKTAGSIAAGDLLIGLDGQSVEVRSVEWVLDHKTVYNLEVEDFHTYFAGGVWVHNDKGGMSAPRTVFKDTAYWNPSLKTDENGKATVTVKMPDNLTTWVISDIANTRETIVGQNTKEIVVTKDVIVRPILPNVARVGDKMVMSALIQNFTEKDSAFEVSLKVEKNGAFGESIDNSENAVIELPLRGQSNPVQINSNTTKQVYWEYVPEAANDKTKLTFSAVSTKDKEDSDTITTELPVKYFGYKDRIASTKYDSATYEINIPDDVKDEESSYQLFLSSSLTGSILSSMEYLVNYPYGCIEQTTSRLVPVIIAKSNPDILSEILKDKNSDDMIDKGLERLRALQNWDGGWSWWSSSVSDVGINSYVAEYLVLLDSIKPGVADDLLATSKMYLENAQSNSNLDPVRFYALSLLASSKGRNFVSLKNEMTPDVISYGVMANLRNGYRNNSTNGAALLLGKAIKQGENLFWEGGNRERFGSKGASTGLAVQALIMANADKDTIFKGVRYLSNSRKYDYWSNTFGTVQVMRALVEYSK